MPSLKPARVGHRTSPRFLEHQLLRSFDRCYTLGYSGVCRQLASDEFVETDQTQAMRVREMLVGTPNFNPVTWLWTAVSDTG